MTAQPQPRTSSSCGELELIVAGRAVACYLACPDLPAELSPRPYLHPVRTLAGVAVTDARPADHPWHLGLSIALPEVDGVNFWGGPSYDRQSGYTWRDDHGHVAHDRWLEQTESSLLQDLLWVGPAGDVLLRERRGLHALPARSRPGGWVLAVRFALTNATERALSLASPSSHGRHQAGYGGFFWRLPAGAPAMSVWSPTGSGVEAVHGRTADWLAAAGRAPDGRPWSVLLVPGDTATADDPWFVRNVEYSAVGSALAFDEALVLAPGATVSRSLFAVIADATLSTPDCMALHREIDLVRRGQAAA